MPIGILIILYALADTIKIPAGCFVAAWIWLIFNVIVSVIKVLDK